MRNPTMIVTALLLTGLSACVEDSAEPTAEPEGQDARAIGGDGDGAAPDGRPLEDAGPISDVAPLRDAEAPPLDAEPPPPDAQAPDRPCDLCAPLEACGYPLSPRECRDLCRQAPPPLGRCIRGAMDCAALGECFEQPEPPGPPPGEERCRAACQRQAQCVALECAPGTLPGGFQQSCFRACLPDPPSPDAQRDLFETRCEDLLPAIRVEYPAIDDRCDAGPDAVCDRLCQDRVAQCDPRIDPAACAADCAATWDAANLQCVQFAQGCERLLACFGDPEGQARCAQVCGRSAECLAEACPPRIISPELATNCTAGCLADPPSAEEAEAFEASSCADVRRFIYQDNRELAPLCEGGREFRPSPEECVAFCDNVLLECLGVGGRDFCLAGCASLTRDAYACAVGAQGDCAAIQACLAGP